MNYSEYRKTRMQGETITLPSGLEVRVKRVTLIDLAFNGEIPQTLNPVTDELLGKGAGVNINTADLGKYGEMVALVVKACLMDPPVADESDDAHIALKDMEADDKIEIFRWANRGASQLEKFRPKQAGDVGNLQSNGHDAHTPVASVEN